MKTAKRRIPSAAVPGIARQLAARARHPHSLRELSCMARGLAPVPPDESLIAARIPKI